MLGIATLCAFLRLAAPVLSPAGGVVRIGINHSPSLCLIGTDGSPTGIHETHGHEAGDLVLVYLAHLLRREPATCDLAVRLGGDEFCLLVRSVEVRRSSSGSKLT